jgi:acyl-CoA thioester hydrolase
MGETGYEVTVPLDVRWRDLDPMGHVNNAVFLTYLERARVEYHRSMSRAALDTRSFRFIIARIEIDYLAPVTLNDQVVCRIGVVEWGAKSFVFRYELAAPGGERVFARARSVQVCYDYQAGRTLAVPDDLRQSVLRLRSEAGLPAPEERRRP